MSQTSAILTYEHDQKRTNFTEPESLTLKQIVHVMLRTGSKHVTRQDRTITDHFGQKTRPILFLKLVFALDW